MVSKHDTTTTVLVMISPIPCGCFSCRITMMHCVLARAFGARSNSHIGFRDCTKCVHMQVRHCTLLHIHYQKSLLSIGDTTHLTGKQLDDRDGVSSNFSMEQNARKKKTRRIMYKHGKKLDACRMTAQL